MSVFTRLAVTMMPLAPKFLVRPFAAPYIAGETLDDAVNVVRDLNAEGAMATVDLLGEEVRVREQATAAVEEYLRAIDAVREHDLDCNFSVKPTHMGLELDEDFCRDNIERLAEVVARDGRFLRIDMEDHTTIDATLRIYRQLHERFSGRRDGHVGVVFQSYMRRTLHDIAELPDNDANVRLCKGIYIEPRKVAWKGYETVRLNFVAALEKLLSNDVYVGIATHDEYLACTAVALIDRMGISRDRYEFQMLLGVDNNLRRILIEGGHRMRVYVPYGRDWFKYSSRRLRENPELVTHILHSMLRRDY
ncbi:MAG: proline dehydrogenase [bacterium]|nr:proline dehydrogenase [bacterium]